MFPIFMIYNTPGQTVTVKFSYNRLNTTWNTTGSDAATAHIRGQHPRYTVPDAGWMPAAVID